jgi:hypothetical protein
MRFVIVLAAAALLAAPAFAQRVVPAPVVPPADQAPPPEGYYKDIPNMYDLLARPQALDNFSLARELRLLNGLRRCAYLPENATDRERVAQRDCSAPSINEFIRSLPAPTRPKE